MLRSENGELKAQRDKLEAQAQQGREQLQALQQRIDTERVAWEAQRRQFVAEQKATSERLATLRGEHTALSAQSGKLDAAVQDAQQKRDQDRAMWEEQRQALYRAQEASSVTVAGLRSEATALREQRDQLQARLAQSESQREVLLQRV